MSDIYLEQWAAQNNVELRTAQYWAKKKKITAKMENRRVLVERTIRKYMIDENEPIPN